VVGDTPSLLDVTWPYCGFEVAHVCGYAVAGADTRCSKVEPPI